MVSLRCSKCRSFYPSCDPNDCYKLYTEVSDVHSLEFQPIAFEKVSSSPDAIIPERATACSAGYDFYSNKEVEIPPFSVLLIPTGIKARIPSNVYLQLCLRSSIAIKKILIMPNSPGIIDADYYNNPSNEGEIMVPVLNLSAVPVKIEKHTKIAQGIILDYHKTSDDYVTAQRIGGLGSTGA